jgi:aminocarboxymuconate-semialdehyde decarboxylase
MSDILVTCLDTLIYTFSQPIPIINHDDDMKHDEAICFNHLSSSHQQQQQNKLCCDHAHNNNNNAITTDIHHQLRKLDIHNHILPKHIPDFNAEFGYGNFISLQHDDEKPGWAQMWKGTEFFRDIDEKCWSVDARLKDMDAEGVQVQVLSTVPVMFSYWAKPQHTYRVSQFLNNDLAKQIAKYPDRFLGLGTLPMQNTKMAVRELRRCVIDLGFVGIEIASHILTWNLDDERFHPLWEEAEKLDICIFVHPWDMMGMKGMAKYWLPWLVSMPAESSRAICSLMFGGVFAKYPRLRFCFAHGGGSFPHTIGRIEHGYNCRPDLIQINIAGDKHNPREYCGHFWIDSLIHDVAAFDYSVALVGADKVILGTDYPFPLGECYPLKRMGQLIEEHPRLSFKEKLQFFWHNGLQFVGRSPQDFKLRDFEIARRELEDEQEQQAIIISTDDNDNHHNHNSNQ